jgi:hypothetical protein
MEQILPGRSSRDDWEHVEHLQAEDQSVQLMLATCYWYHILASSSQVPPPGHVYDMRLLSLGRLYLLDCHYAAEHGGHRQRDHKQGSSICYYLLHLPLLAMLQHWLQCTDLQ